MPFTPLPLGARGDAALSRVVDHCRLVVSSKMVLGKLSVCSGPGRCPETDTRNPLIGKLSCRYVKWDLPKVTARAVKNPALPDGRAREGHLPLSCAVPKAWHEGERGGGDH